MNRTIALALAEHRPRPIEAAPWLVAAAVYFIFADRLPGLSPPAGDDYAVHPPCEEPFNVMRLANGILASIAHEYADLSSSECFLRPKCDGPRKTAETFS